MAKEESALRMPSGKQCCLGFVCRAFGVEADAMTYVGFPSDLSHLDREPLPKWLLSDKERADVRRAATINDDEGLSDSEREKKIRAIFKRRGLRAVFTA